MGSPIMQMNGYEPKTTFWQDFTIADHFGIDAIKDTFNRAFEEWKTNVEYFTEFVMVLNHKIWQYYETDEEKAFLYNDLWEQADAYGCENFTGDDLTYFYTTLD